MNRILFKLKTNIPSIRLLTTTNFTMRGLSGGINTNNKNICNIIRNNVRLNTIVITLCYLFCLCHFSFSVASKITSSSVRKTMRTGSALASSTSTAGKNTFNENNPIAKEANEAVAEALAYKTISYNDNNNNQGSKKPLYKSKYCHNPTKECFVKNLATLPYGKLKYLTSMLDKKFSNGMNKHDDDMRFKASSKLKHKETKRNKQRLSSMQQQKSSSSSQAKFNIMKMVTAAPLNMLQSLMGMFAMRARQAERLKPSDLASHRNAFEPIITGGDPSTFTDRLAQAGLEGFHPPIGYETETPGCAKSMSEYFHCSALKNTPLHRGLATDPRQMAFRSRKERLMHVNLTIEEDKSRESDGLSQSLSFASRLLHKNDG